MIRPLDEFLDMRDISRRKFALAIGTSHQVVANWLAHPTMTCFVEFDPRNDNPKVSVSKVTLEKTTVVFDRSEAAA